MFSSQSVSHGEEVYETNLRGLQVEEEVACVDGVEGVEGVEGVVEEVGPPPMLITMGSYAKSEAWSTGAALDIIIMGAEAMGLESS
jgi:hypothetical protein